MATLETRLKTMESLWAQVLHRPNGSGGVGNMAELVAAATASPSIPALSDEKDEDDEDIGDRDVVTVVEDEDAVEDDIDAMGSLGFAEGNPGYFGYSSTLGFVAVLLKAVVRASQGVMEPSRFGIEVQPTAAMSSSPLDQTTDLNAQALSVPRSRVDPYVLPPRHRVMRLFDAYFNNTHTLYPYLHRSSIQQAYNEASATGFKHVRPSWLALLNLIFALAVQTSIDTNIRLERAEAALFFQRAKRVFSQNILSTNSLESMQVMLLLCQYLQSSRKPNQCWNVLGIAIRIGQGLGLHMMKASNSAATRLEKEMRKRTWYAAIVLDVALAMTYGRPVAVSSISYSVELPEDQPDEYFEDKVSSARTLLPNEVTPNSFFVHTIRLYQIMGRAVETIFGSNNMEARTVEALETPEFISQLGRLEGDLTDWLKRLPTRLTLPVPQNPTSLADRIVCRQATILNLRYHHCESLVHRPYVVAELHRTAPFSFEEQQQPMARQHIRTSLGQATANASIAACILSSRQVLGVIHDAMYNPAQLGAKWYSIYYTFSATLLLMASGLIAHRSGRPFIEGSMPEELRMHCVYIGKAFDIFKSFATDNASAVRHLTFLNKLMPNFKAQLEENERYFDLMLSTDTLRPAVPTPVISNSDFLTQPPNTSEFEQTLDNVYLQDIIHSDLMDTNERSSLSWLFNSLPAM